MINDKFVFELEEQIKNIKRAIYYFNGSEDEYSIERVRELTARKILVDDILNLYYAVHKKPEDESGAI